MHRTYHLKILTDGKIKGMSVACEEACTYDDMLAAMVSKFGADRIVELIAK